MDEERLKKQQKDWLLKVMSSSHDDSRSLAKIKIFKIMYTTEYLTTSVNCPIHISSPDLYENL